MLCFIVQRSTGRVLLCLRIQARSGKLWICSVSFRDWKRRNWWINRVIVDWLVDWLCHRGISVFFHRFLVSSTFWNVTNCFAFVFSFLVWITNKLLYLIQLPFFHKMCIIYNNNNNNICTLKKLTRFSFRHIWFMEDDCCPVARCSFLKCMTTLHQHWTIVWTIWTHFFFVMRIVERNSI